jgi:hypothetical protein
MDTRTANDYPMREERGLAAQWVGLLLAPAAFFAHLQFAYANVPWACSHGNALWLHVSGVASVVLAAVGTLVAWRTWQRAGGDAPGEGGGIPSRTGDDPRGAGGALPPRVRFLAVTGLGTSATITLILLAQWVAAFIISPCE